MRALAALARPPVWLTARFGAGQAYYLLDELLIAGELQETSRKLIVVTQKKIEQAESEDSLFDTLKLTQIL
jgi:hypothetical protein